VTTQLEEVVAAEQADHDAQIEGTASGPDADKGKLFEVPRVVVAVDETDPGTIKLAFSGSIELDRAKADDVAFYNSRSPARTSAS
jgi:hypothetical protein